MQFRKRIRSQMYYGAAILLFIVLALSAAGLQGVMKFRKLTKNIRDRATELPLAAQLSTEISNLRVTFSRIEERPQFPVSSVHQFLHNESDCQWLTWADQFRLNLNNVNRALNEYEFQLNSVLGSQSHLTDNSLELNSVVSMHSHVDWMYHNARAQDFCDPVFMERLRDKLTELQGEASLLPEHMKQRMEKFAFAARKEYHTWITVAVLMTFGAVLLLGLLIRRFRAKIFSPLDELVCGSRRVAAGDFDHRIQLDSDDEVAELAAALNSMTSNFQAIKADLNSQVQQRTREVVRSEQMASVGFLAAGVAHEINNPLASIAWSAESLETRLHDILSPDCSMSDEQRQDEIGEMKKYLQRIQEEAFRCKGITSSLLNFSRLGDAQKTPTEMASLIEDVVDMLRPLSRYRDKEIVVDCDRGVTALVNAQEIKQVVLNLVTNALDSIDRGGVVTVQMQQDKAKELVHLVVADNGCGMDDDVLQNIFEPFFTKRRDGQGTGLGLSITWRIIQEHGGSIRPHSNGPGHGSTFTVSLPLVNHEEERERKRQAA